MDVKTGKNRHYENFSGKRMNNCASNTWNLKIVLYLCPQTIQKPVARINSVDLVAVQNYRTDIIEII